jgi:pyruvate formate lyase activating enzyme
MKCKCCQNWQISQVSVKGFNFSRTLNPGEITAFASSRADNIGVAYTYNEPGVWYEYMIDIARHVHAKGLKNVMVSNGFICGEPLRQLMMYMDAFNIDLKGFTDKFYRKLTGANLSPVLDSLKQISNAGKHLEITYLVIPTMNDDPVVFGAMTEWIAAELGTSTVLHLSRYHPVYNLDIEPTPADLLIKLYTIARRKLSYVYIGNISVGESQDTHCSRCGEKIISRQGYQVIIKSLGSDGSCKACGNRVLIC